LYTKADPIPYNPYDGTSATYVDTEEAVLEMLEELKTAKEIAIDLEHHDTHSYIGLVSLMQISTRNKDWIVDTLRPWRRRLESLNEVFANPDILKVGTIKGGIVPEFADIARYSMVLRWISCGCSEILDCTSSDSSTHFMPRAH